jgi:O-antigen/teichoic acid export membrane protein
MLSFLWDNQATGLFAACMTLVGASRVLTDASFNVLTPKSARAFHLGGRPALLRVLRQWAAMFTVLMGLFTLATALVGEKILVVVYGPEYAGTTTPLMLLALGLAVHTLGCTCADGLFVLERTRENFWADVISTGLVLIVSVPLISNWGVTGAALTTLIAMSSGALARAAILWRCWSLHDEVGSGPGDA